MERTLDRGYSAQRPASGSVLDRALDLSRVNWEVVYFAVLMIFVVGTRLWDLGSRAFHHDESIHAFYSYQFFNGQPWAYDPAYHGPFLYTVVALSFLLFGVTDATARLMPALFGIGLIFLIWFMRPYIGRIGTLAAATIVAFSPSILYYSRALRHDIFALVGTMLLFLAILGFIRTHKGKYLFLGSAGLAIAYTSHELIFVNVAIFVLFLVVAWAWVRFLGVPGDKDGKADVDPVASAVVALGDQKWALLGAAGLFVAVYVVLFSNFMTNPGGIIDGIYQGVLYWGQPHIGRGDQPWYYYILLMIPIYEPLGFFAGIAFLVAMLVKTFRGNPGVPADLPDEALVEETVRTTARGGETRERRVLSLTASGTDEYGLGLPSAAVMSGFTLVFLAFWGFGAIVAYSLAGEKMPWLLMQIALPFGLLAGAGVGRLLGLGRVDWGKITREGGVLVGALVVLLLFGLQTFFSNLGGVGGAGVEQQQAILKSLVVGAFVVLMVGGIVWLAQRIGWPGTLRTVAVTLVLLFFAYEIRSSTLASFRNGDVPVDLLVYVQSTPDTPMLAERIDRLGRDLTAFSSRDINDVTGGNSMDIAMDTDVEWPFDWYWRDQRKIGRFTNDNLAIPPSAPVILAGTAVHDNPQFQSIVAGKYLEERYKLNWWFPEETYKKDGFVGEYFANLINPANWSVNSQPGKYLIYRDPGAPLGARDLYVYTRNDLVSRVGTPTDSGTAEEPPSNVVYGMTELPPPGAGKGQFNQPRDIAIGPDGSFYVVDTSNMRVQKFDKDGKYLLSFGEEGTGNGQFTGLIIDGSRASGTGPGGIAVDKSGNVYVADTWNHRVQKFDSSGKFLTQWGGFVNLNDAEGASDPAANTKFYGPRGLAVDSAGNVYVSDTGNKRVMVYDPNGKFIRQVAESPQPGQASFNGPNQLNEPIGIVLDAADNLYVADLNNRRIVKFDKNGAPVTNWPVNGWEASAFLEPFMAAGPDGNLYVTDPAGQKVDKYSPDGQLIGSKASENNVSLIRPTGITVDSGNVVWVVDTEKNGVVRLGTIDSK